MGTWMRTFGGSKGDGRKEDWEDLKGEGWGSKGTASVPKGSGSGRRKRKGRRVGDERERETGLKGKLVGISQEPKRVPKRQNWWEHLETSAFAMADPKAVAKVRDLDPKEREGWNGWMDGVGGTSEGERLPHANVVVERGSTRVFVDSAWTVETPCGETVD